jgi:hypothetical protein
MADIGLQESEGKIVAGNGELLTETFFNVMAAEIDELLQAKASIEVGDIAKHFALSADLVNSCIEKFRGSIIQGECCPHS